jgi:hypothetical protein
MQKNNNKRSQKTGQIVKLGPQKDAVYKSAKRNNKRLQRTG